MERGWVISRARLRDFRPFFRKNTPRGENLGKKHPPEVKISEKNTPDPPQSEKNAAPLPPKGSGEAQESSSELAWGTQ